MTTQDNPYEGDPIKLIRVKDIDFGKHRNSTKTTNKRAQTLIQKFCKNAGIIFVGDFDKYAVYKPSDKETRLQDPKGHITDQVADTYVPVIGETLHEVGYSLEGYEPKSSKSDTNSEPNPMKGFCMDGFDYAVSKEGDNVRVEVFDIPTVFARLIEDKHLCFDDHMRSQSGITDKDENVILKETKANNLQYADDGSEITLFYDLKNGEYNSIESKINITDAMKRAATHLIPKGQERAMKRYGITPP